MGITIVQKSNLAKPKPNPKIALVLAGGGVSGGAFKLGGMIALNNFMVNKDIRDFDIYVGVSAGSILSLFLANGIPTEELLKSLEGRKGLINPILASDFYYFNTKEFLLNPLLLIKDIFTLLPLSYLNFLISNNIFREKFRKKITNLLISPDIETIGNFIKFCFSNFKSSNISKGSLPWRYIPNGFFITDEFERSIRKNLSDNNMINDFKELYKIKGKELYIYSTNLDAVKRAVFGHDEINTVSISKAMQASIAVPIFYKPVEINGTNFVDGGVINTAGMDLAIKKGADLIICYNPFRPFNFESFSLKYDKKNSKYCIADDGLYVLVNQVFRTILHTRLIYGMERYRKNPDFNGDIILIEPTEYDDKFFDMNPLAFWERRKASKRGYASVRTSIQQNYKQLEEIFKSYGIRTSFDFAYEPINQLPTTFGYSSNTYHKSLVPV